MPRRAPLAVLALAAAVLLSGGAAAAPQDEAVPQDETLPQETGPQEAVPRDPAAQDEARAGDETPARPPAAAPERTRFELPLPAEKGGGVVRGRAAELEFVRENYAAASGGVEITYQDVKLQAERVELDLATQEVTATGEVMFDQGPRRITGERAVFNLETKTGTFYEADAFVAPDYYFRGTEVSKVGDDKYTVLDGVFTSCEGDKPSWSFRLARADVEVEGYARIHNASMRLKSVPVLYTPYIVWPAKTERTSGFLVPEIGYSERKGAQLGLAYYQVLGPSWDTTFHLDLYSEEYVGIGNELRYRPSEGTHGNVIGYAIRDPQAKTEAGLDEWRWKVDWNHVTEDLPGGLRGVISYHDFSDFEFFRDFERDFDRNTIRFLESYGFVSGDWGPHSLNVLVNDRETFLAPATATTPERTITQSKLPEIEYRLRPTQLFGAPLYLDVLSSASYLFNDRQRNYNSSYGRFDLFPQLTVPLRVAPWLSVSLSGGGRFTWYGNSIYSDAELAALPADERDQILANSRFKDQSLSRAVPFAGAQIVGPSFSRIYGSDGGAKVKHVIEPRFTVSWLGDFDEQANVPNFDEVDDLRRTVGGFGLGSTQSGRWSLYNRLLVKPAPKKAEATEEGSGAEGDGAEGETDGDGAERLAEEPPPSTSAREVLSMEVSQEISFDDKQPLQFAADGSTAQEGPVRGVLRFTPSLKTNFKAQVDYSLFLDNLVSTSFSGSHSFGVSNVGATWYTRYNAQSGDTTSDQLRFNAGLQIVPRRLRFDTQLNYDIEQSLLQQQTYILSYTSQCYALRFEMRDFRATSRRDTEYFFSFSLKNVGTLLPLTARSSSALP